MSTKKDGSFITTEQKAVRAADLLGMAGDYSQFVTNSVNLKIEFELLNDQPISWSGWKTVSSDIVESYISKEIALTKFFRKCGNTSPFEEAARRNLKALLADPVVDNAVAAEKMLDNMTKIQKQHLGYLI